MRKRFGAFLFTLVVVLGASGAVPEARAQEKPPHSPPAGGSPILPVPDEPFGGAIGRKASESKPDFPVGVAAGNLASLTTNAWGNTVFNTGNVSAAEQTYNDNVVLTANIQFNTGNATQLGNFTISSTGSMEPSAVRGR